MGSVNKTLNRERILQVVNCEIFPSIESELIFPSINIRQHQNTWKFHSEISQKTQQRTVITPSSFNWSWKPYKWSNSCKKKFSIHNQPTNSCTCTSQHNGCFTWSSHIQRHHRNRSSRQFNLQISQRNFIEMYLW